MDESTAQVFVYTNPTVEEQRFLVESYQIDEHTLASALDPDEQPRLEFEPEHIVMIYKRPKNYSGKDQLEFKVASVGMFLFEDKLVVVLAEDIPLFVGKRFAVVSSIKEVFLKLVYNSISHYVEHLRIIHMISEEIEDKMTESMDNTYLLNLFSLEKSLVYYAEAITSNGFVFEKPATSRPASALTKKTRKCWTILLLKICSAKRRRIFIPTFWRSYWMHVLLSSTTI